MSTRMKVASIINTKHKSGMWNEEGNEYAEVFCYMGWHWTWAYRGTKPRSKLMCDRMRRAKQKEAMPAVNPSLSQCWAVLIINSPQMGYFKYCAFCADFSLKNKKTKLLRDWMTHEANLPFYWRPRSCPTPCSPPTLIHPDKKRTKVFTRF